MLQSLVIKFEGFSIISLATCRWSLKGASQIHMRKFDKRLPKNAT
jgi:hypothetical protein